MGGKCLPGHGGEDKGSQMEGERHGCIQKRMGTHLVKLGNVCVCVCVCVCVRRG